MRTSAFRLHFLVSPALLLAFTASIAIPASAQALTTSSQPARITHIIDESSLVTLRGNTPPLAQAKFDQGPAPASLPAPRMLLVLTRSTQQEADLQTYLQSVQNADSPAYRKFLSPDEFGARFGVSDSDLQSIQTWLTTHGFTINKVSRGRTAIEFSGTVDQLQTAFHTSIHSYLINGVSQLSNSIDPQIPAALAPVVAGLASLNSFRPKAHFARGPSGFYNAATHTITPTYTVGDYSSGYYVFLGPADAATAYDTPTTLNATPPSTTYTGSGVTIGIAGDSNVDISQNANYRSTFGLSANPLTVVIDGTDPGENGDALEAYLDTELSSGIAPSANVILYTAADTELNAGLFLAIQRALDDNQADILNVSFGSCEASLGTSGNQYIQNLWEQAAAQGVSVTVSAGDSGSAGCDNFDTENVASQGLAVSGFASTPYAIAVGGTDFDILYSNYPGSFTYYVDITNSLPNHRSVLQYIPEEPWNDSTLNNTAIATDVPLAGSGSVQGDDIIAGSGGISSVYPVPSWQSTFATGTGRNMPDVSFLAANGFYGALWGLCTDMDTDSNNTPISDCTAPTTGNNFNLTGAGGTSAAAPAFAGMLALLKQKTGSRLGQADYALYQLAKTNYSTVFHDVTTGDNSVNCASGSPNCSLNTAGFDFMTGYNAATGYDLASGLGSVDAGKMISDWSSVTFTSTTSALKLNGGTAALNITHGQSVTVADSVTGTSGTPTGNIALVDSLSPANNPNNEGIADFALASGSVSGTTTALPGGTYSVSAHYGGSSTFAESVSNAIPVTVAAESSTTTLTVAGVYDPTTGNQVSTPYYGFIYLIDAQPYGNSSSASNPNGAATGTITFKTGTTTLGTAPLASDGIAELQTVLLPGGTDNLTAAFPGDASFKASTSAPTPFTVTPAVTTLSSLNDNYVATNPISLFVTLSTDSAGVAPTGTVTFQSGTTILGSAPLSGAAANNILPARGSADFESNFLPPGTYNITGVYSGDSNYAPSTSPVLSVTLPKASTAITVTPSSSTVLSNQSVQVTVSETQLTGLPVPTGSVTLTYGSVTTAATSLVNGTASFTVPANSLPIGYDSIAGNYSGDADYVANTASAAITVNPSGATTPTVKATGPTGTVNYPVSITVKVSGPSGSPVPTGIVNLVGSNNQPSLTLNNGSATYSYQNGDLTPGPNSITAQYTGDSNYTAGNSQINFNLVAPASVSFAPFQPTITVNQPLTETIAVTGMPNFATATGTVTLSSGSYSSGPIALSAGSASITIPANSLAVGTDTLAADYSGDTNFTSSTGNETVTVNYAGPPAFALTATAVSVTPGAYTGNTSTITATPSNGFTGSVILTAVVTSAPTGSQDLPTWSFGTSPSQGSIGVYGTSPETTTVTITTTAPSTAALTRPAFPGIRWYQGGTALACLLLFGIPARRRRWRTLLGMLIFLAFAIGGVISCGGGGSSGGGGGGTTPTDPGTTPGTYVITVTGTSTTLSTTTTINVTVQ